MIAKSKAELKVNSKDNQSKMFRKGFFLWALVLLGYFTFVVNWLLLNQLAGTAGINGWVNHYFGSEGTTKTVSQAVNYTITAVRGIGAIFGGWVVVKIGHKYSVLIALFLLSIATISGWLPSYAAFIISRMLMALGGTVLIVYIQPILSQYIFKPKTRSVFSTINLFGFNLGTLIAWLPFMFVDSKKLFINNWQLVSTLFALPTIVVIILYAIFAENIKVGDKDQLNKKHEKLKSSNWKKVIKEKRVWNITILYGAWIVAVVIPTAIISQYLKLSNEAAFTGDHNIYKIPLYNILFVLPVIFGPFTFAYVNKSNLPRKPFIAGFLFLGIAFMGFSLLAGTENNLPGMFICVFLSGWCLWGIQGVILHSPHEWEGKSPVRLGLIFGFMWGFGYLIYTVVNIVIALPFDLLTASTTVWLFPVMYLGVSSIAVIFTFLLVETRPRQSKKHKINKAQELENKKLNL